MGWNDPVSEKGVSEEMESMKLVKDGRDWRVSVDGGWIIEDGALVLSRKQVVQLIDILTFNPMEEMEHEDG